MTDFNKLLAADELLNDIHNHEVKQKSLEFHGMPIEIREEVPPHQLYIFNGQEPIMRVDLTDKKDWGFIEFTKHSADYMLGSIHPVVFWLGLPFAWLKFDRKQRRDR